MHTVQKHGLLRERDLKDLQDVTQESAWGAHKKECKRIAKQMEKEQWFMGHVSGFPPHPRWANPAEEDKVKGKTPEEVTNGGNPMLGGWMLGLDHADGRTAGVFFSTSCTRSSHSAAFRHT